MLDQNSRVNGLIVNALLGVLFNDVKKVVWGQGLDIAVDAF